MLARAGHKVIRLKRIALGPVQLDHLASGKARRLSAPEREALRRAATRQQRRSPQVPVGRREDMEK